MNNLKNDNQNRLIDLYLDGALTGDQKKNFCRWLKEDPRHIEEFVSASFLHRSMYDILYGQISHTLISESMGSAKEYESELWKALQREEKTAPSVTIKHPPQPVVTKTSRNTDYLPVRGSFNRSAWITVFASLAALLFLIVLVKIKSREYSEPVAVISDVITGSKDSRDWSAKQGIRLFTKQEPLQLSDDTILKIKFDNGADITLEGPGQFELTAYNAIKLYSGRLYAYIPKQAIGFTVNTANARVIDLGTGFGVYADPLGNIEVHVLDGKVSLFSGLQSDTWQSQLVTENQAFRVLYHSEVIQPAVFRQQDFVRTIHSKTNFVWKGQHLDLADMVGGGNGLGTGQLGKWINITNGSDGTDYFRQDGDRTPGLTLRKTDYLYHPVVHLPYVDGVFCPDGDKGPVTITSMGHQWTDCPDTLGIFFEDIYNGSEMKQRRIDYTLSFDDQTYGTREHPAIAVHANAGITFDLDAIRRDMPGIEILRFKSKCGITKDARTLTDVKKMDFGVLIDGQMRFKISGRDNQAVSSDISVEIKPGDRFLTLVSTDGGLNAGYDWGFFAEPRLEIAEIE